MGAFKPEVLRHGAGVFTLEKSAKHAGTGTKGHVMTLVDYALACVEKVVIVLALLLVGLIGWANVALRRDLKQFEENRHGGKENTH